MASDIYVYGHGGVLGYGANRGAEITALFVHPQYRGKSIGKILLTFLMTKAPLPVYLYVAKSNIAAKNLYRDYGFEIVEEFQTS